MGLKLQTLRYDAKQLLGQHRFFLINQILHERAPVWKSLLSICLRTAFRKVLFIIPAHR